MRRFAVNKVVLTGNGVLLNTSPHPWVGFAIRGENSQNLETRLIASLSEAVFPD